MKPKINIGNIKKRIARFVSSSFWFTFGFIFAGLLLLSLVIIYFEQTYKDKIYPGVYVEDTYVGEKTQKEVKDFFEKKNNTIKKTSFQFSYEDYKATASAEQLNIGYDSELLTQQAYSIGRSNNIISNFYLILSSYINGVYLVSSYTQSQDTLNNLLEPINKQIYKEPVDALFKVENNRVVAFRESSDGRSIDSQKLEEIMQEKTLLAIKKESSKFLFIDIPVKITKPEVSTQEANDLGIVEVIGEGRSYFAHSIPNRIHNVTLAASRINGVIVAPGEIFSFNQAVGDISKFTGYKEAYVIKEGKTVLGDGGGVCQVSTTLFRAILNSGLPITERQAHAYRVAYYEQNFPPGIDATIYSPSVDLRFRNDTGSHILIQSFIDPANAMLVFTIYGKKDGREISITTPVITNQISPAPPIYQDDPNLPKGTVKQTEYAAYGANVSFSRTVKKDGKVLYSNTFTSHYTPWQAVFLQGTKEN